MERPAVRQRYAAPDSAICHLGYGPVSYRIDSSNEWTALWLLVAASRCDRHLHAVISAFWEVLPHFSAPGSDGYRFLQARWGGRRLCALRSLRTTVRLAIADCRLKVRPEVSLHSVSDGRRLALPGCVSAVPPQNPGPEPGCALAHAGSRSPTLRRIVMYG